ncbi:MAG: type II secretion system protein [Pseudomonadota bacterium]
MNRGFTMLELTIVIAISGLMLGFVLQATKSNQSSECYATTKVQLATVQTAITSFVRKNDRYPMPARRDIGVSDANYGREAVAANLTVSGTTTWGALPFQALGLPTSFAGDCWGNKFTYVVTTALTTNAASGGYLDAAVVGTITVKSGASTTSSTAAAYAVISQGEDMLNAAALNATSVSWCGTGTTLATYNCYPANSPATVANALFNNGKNAGAAYFDDLVIAADRARVI